MKQLLQDILNGSVEEKMEAVETIWNSIDEHSVPVTDEEITIAKERYKEYLLHPNDAVDWDVARKKLMDKYGF